MAQKTLAARRASVRYARSGPRKASSRGFVVLTKTPTIDRDIQYWQVDVEWQDIANDLSAGDDEFDLRDEGELPIVYFDD